jgi:crotonobetainyl-CoA:carnitine CoA-transferase CaiB-like acyl-CoA transferase
MWMMAPLIMAAEIDGADRMPYYRRSEAPNPIANQYITKDGRVIHLALMVYDRYAKEFFAAVGRPDLFADDRFANAVAVRAHSAELIAILDELFASKPLAEWEEILKDIDGVWDVARYVGEVPHDPQAIANGYMAHIDTPGGTPFPLVTNPVQFDETPVGPSAPAPELGQHTEELMLEAGLDWDEILRLKEAGAVL